MYPMLVIALVVAVSGCGIRRTIGPAALEHPLGSYEYCVVSEAETHGYSSVAKEVLSGAFTIIDESDPELERPDIRQRTLRISIGWLRGFWNTGIFAKLLDFQTKQVIIENYVRSPGLWSVNPDFVRKVIVDLAEARKAARPGTGPQPLAPPISTLRLYDMRSASVLEGECLPTRARCTLQVRPDQVCEGDFVMEQRAKTVVAATALGNSAVVASPKGVVGTGYVGATSGTSEVDNMNNGVLMFRCAGSIIDCKLTADSNSGQGHGECSSTDGASYRLTLIPQAITR